MYRDDQSSFRSAFNNIYPDISGNTAAQVWHERLNFEHEGISWGTSNELLFIIVASCIAGLIAKLPEFLGINEEYFYPRNIGFIFFPLLTIYFAWKQKLPVKNLVASLTIMLGAALYINFLPKNDNSDTLILACIHLPVFIWTLVGFTFTGNDLKNHQGRLDYLRYIGDLIVMTTILLLSGGILTGVTLGLFSLIGVMIQEFYFKYIVVCGLAAAPIIGTYLVQTNPQLVRKVSPVIAKVFTPLVLIMLVSYLVAIIYTGKDPYNDREFLIVFNLLLIGVMAIILFSIAETSKNIENKISNVLLLALSIVTIIVNGIALSAIVFRISEWGITPNRLAVLGGNILILTNLLIVTYKLFQSVKDNTKTEGVAGSIAAFLPIYSLWTIIVTFVFPFVFGFR